MRNFKIFLIIFSTFIFISSKVNAAEKYTVIAGAFENRIYAEKLASRISENGYLVQVLQMDTRVGKLFRVCVGIEDNLDNAKILRKKLSRELNQSNLWILKHNFNIPGKIKDKNESKGIGVVLKKEEPKTNIISPKKEQNEIKITKDSISDFSKDIKKVDDININEITENKPKDLQNEKIDVINSPEISKKNKIINSEKNDEIDIIDEKENKKINLTVDKARKNDIIKNDKIDDKDQKTVVMQNTEVPKNLPNREKQPSNLNLQEYLRSFKAIINTFERKDHEKMKEYISPEFGFLVLTKNNDRNEAIQMMSSKDYFELDFVKENEDYIANDLKITRLTIPKVGSLPQYDCKSNKYRGMGLYTAKINNEIFEDYKFNDSKFGIMLKAYSKISDFQAVNTDNKVVYGFYFTNYNKKWYLSMINMIEPCK